MSRKDTILRILIVVGVLYTALLMIMIVLLAMTMSALSGLRVSYDSLVGNTEQLPVSAPVTPEVQTNVDNPETSTKVRKTLVIPTSKFAGGVDRTFSAVFSGDIVVTDNSNLTGGGGYVGLKVTGDNLEMRFGAPYESASLRYIEKTFIFKGTMGDVYRLKTSDGYVLYTNKFYVYQKGITMCNPDSGTSDECGGPSLTNSADNDATANFVVSCDLTSVIGLSNCDEVVKTIEFVQ